MQTLTLIYAWDRGNQRRKLANFRKDPCFAGLFGLERTVLTRCLRFTSVTSGILTNMTPWVDLRFKDDSGDNENLFRGRSITALQCQIDLR